MRFHIACNASVFWEAVQEIKKSRQLFDEHGVSKIVTVLEWKMMEGWYAAV